MAGLSASRYPAGIKKGNRKIAVTMIPTTNRANEDSAFMIDSPSTGVYGHKPLRIMRIKGSDRNVYDVNMTKPLQTQLSKSRANQ